VSVSESS